MPTHLATCHCGQLRVHADGEPVRVSVCHCLACQRRTGSAFGVQARYAAERVRVEGRASEHVRISDEGEERIFSFCPRCGSTVTWRTADAPELVAIAVGAFADPGFTAPSRSIYEARRHPWVGLPEGLTSEP